MTKYTQEPPFSCQIELSEGCNLRCPFCGINGIRSKERTYKFMSLETASRIATSIGELGWNCRTEFALHGEPTQNPETLKLLKIFRDNLPKNYFLIETNGSGFLGKDSDDITRKVLSYFEAGLDTIGLDEYQNVPWGNLVRTKVNREALTEAGITFHEYPSDPKGNPHQRTRQKRLVIIAPIDLSDKGTHASLNNHCGSGAPLDASMIHERCAKPFREISFRWDGSVSICCNSWDGLYQIGNIHEMSVSKIWQHPRFMAARQKLLHKERDFRPCLGCNNRSYRVGLLPDKFGKQTLPPPDVRTQKLIDEVIALGPYTIPVPREWDRDYDKLLVQIETNKPKSFI